MSKPTQLERLDTLLRLCAQARMKADKGELFASHVGLELCMAAYDLFQCDDLWDLCEGVCRELNTDEELDYLLSRVRNLPGPPSSIEINGEVLSRHVGRKRAAEKEIAA